MNENMQPQPNFYNNHFFSENEKPVLLGIAKNELHKQVEKLNTNNLKLQLFEDCFEEMGLLKGGKVYTMKDFQEIDLQLYMALEKVYTEEVVMDFLYPETKI